MSVALSKRADPRAVVEASQALRAFMGAPNDIGYIRQPANTDRPAPNYKPLCRARLKWTRQDRNFIREMAGVASAQAIADRLGRSRLSVVSKANDLGIGLSLARKKSHAAHPNASPEEKAQAVFIACTKRMRDIILEVSQERGIPVELLLGTTRMKTIAEARQHLIWRIIRDTPMTMSAVAHRIGMDHTTARHAVLREDARQGTNVHAKRAANYGSWS